MSYRNRSRKPKRGNIIELQVMTACDAPSNNRLKLAARGRPVAE